MTDTETRVLKKPSVFLRSLEPHLVYDNAELSMDYVVEVGRKPSWPVRSAKRAQADMVERHKTRKKLPKDCWMDTAKPLSPVCYGWEVAAGVAADFISGWTPGSADIKQTYRQAITSLEEIER